MPNETKFVVIHNGTFALPGEGGVNDRHISFDVPDVDPDSFAILLYRVDPDLRQGNPFMQVLVNGRQLFGGTFTQEATKSWHEIVPRGTLRRAPDQNVLDVALPSGGRVELADFVLFYVPESD